MLLNRKLAILLLAFMNALTPFFIDSYVPSLPAIGRSYGVDAASVQITLAAFMVGLAFGQMWYGPISDKVGRKPPLLVAFSLLVVVCIACSMAPSLAVLTGLRFVQALACCAGGVIAMAIVRDLFHGKEAANVYAYLVIAIAVSPMVAPVVGGYVLVWAGWRAIFLVQAALVAILLALCVFMPETRPQEAVRPLSVSRVLKSYGELLSDRSFAGYTFATGIGGGALFAYVSGASHVLIDLYGVAPQNFGWLFSGNAIAVMIFARVTTLIQHRVGTVRMQYWAMAAQALAGVIALVSWALFGGLLSFVLPMFLVIGCFGAVAPTSMALAMESQHMRAGAASAVFGTAQFGVGAICAGILSSVPSDSAALLVSVAAAFAVCGFVINATVPIPPKTEPHHAA